MIRFDRLLLRNAGHLVEFRLADHLAAAVECSTELNRQSPDMKISIDLAAFLESQSILDEDIALNLAPKVDILAKNIALDDCSLTDDNTSFTLDLAFKSTVNTDIIWRNDLTLDNRSCRNSAYRIRIYNRFHFCHNYLDLKYFTLKSLSVAILELLARTARTWIISTDLLLDMNRHIALLLATISHQIRTGSLHLAHIRLTLLSRSLGL